MTTLPAYQLPGQLRDVCIRLPFIDYFPVGPERLDTLCPWTGGASAQSSHNQFDCIWSIEL